MIPVVLSALIALSPTAVQAKAPVWMESKPVSLIYTYRKDFVFPPGEYQQALYATIPTYNSPAVTVRIKVHGEALGSKLKLPVFPPLFVTLDDVPEEYIPNKIVKVDKENFSLRVPNVGAARFHIERDPGPRIRAVGVVEADIVRGIEKVTEKWKEVNGRYEVDLGIKGAGEYAIDFGLMIDLGGHEVPVPSHLTAKWNGKVLFDRTQADQRVTAHVVDGSRWYDDYTIHLTLSPVGQVKQAHPTLAILFFEHPRAPIWEIK